MTTTTTANGTFTLDRWDQQDDDPAAGTTFGHARVTKTFSGDLVGTSTAQLVLIGLESDVHAWVSVDAAGSRREAVQQRLTGT